MNLDHKLKVAVDIGGTFTDVMAVRGDAVAAVKVPEAWIWEMAGPWFSKSKVIIIPRQLNPIRVRLRESVES